MAKTLAKLVALLTPKRRWTQFSLATMFVVVALLCVGLSLVVAPAERQRRAVAAIKALGGRVVYVKPSEEASEAFPRPFLRRWLAQDYFDEVQEVDLHYVKDEDLNAGLTHLHGLTGLQGLCLSGTHVTDAGLDHLHGLTGLQGLNLDGTQVKGAGLKYLQGLMGLQGISLSGTQVTDAGLAHLQGLTGLTGLSLIGTQVTDAGLAHLHGLTRLQVLWLSGSQVTDAGLAHLHGLTGLKWVSFGDTQVTDAGIAEFKKALPNCEIER